PPTFPDTFAPASAETIPGPTKAPDRRGATRTHLKTPSGSFEMSVLPEKTVEHSSQKALRGFLRCALAGRAAGAGGAATDLLQVAIVEVVAGVAEVARHLGLAIVDDHRRQ